jgi:hypothetical protein
MCVCECLGAWACACACVRVALLSQHATSTQHVVTFVAPQASPHFSTFSHKGTTFGKKLLSIKYVFRFPLQSLSNIFLSLRRIQQDIVIDVKTSSCKVPVILVRF